MGQKVNPNGLRIGISRPWSGQWYADRKKFAETLKQDIDIRRFLEPRLKEAGLSRIDIQRTKVLTVICVVQKPGVVIGQDGTNMTLLKNGLERIVNGKVTKKQLATKLPTDTEINISVVEVKNPDFDANLVAQSIASQIENRASFRMVQKKAIQRVMRAGAKGIKTQTAGRLNGAEISRAEYYRDGALGLETLSANIDYALCEAHTIYGVIGVKVWIARPDNFTEEKSVERSLERRPFRGGNRRPQDNNRSGGRQGGSSSRSPRPQGGASAPRKGE